VEHVGHHRAVDHARARFSRQTVRPVAALALPPLSPHPSTPYSRRTIVWRSRATARASIRFLRATICAGNTTIV